MPDIEKRKEMNYIWCNCKCFFNIFLLILIFSLSYSHGYSQDYSENSIVILREGFNHLPDSATPGVYWYFMDGWMSQNGIRKDLGVVWTAPWHADITGIVKRKGNHLKISVANLWPNRLIGDQQLENDGIKNEEFPGWLLNCVSFS